MRDFHQHAPTSLHFGRRSLSRVGRVCRGLGLERVLLVTGQGSCHRHDGFATLTASLDRQGLGWQECAGVPSNPPLDLAQEVCHAARDFGAQGLVALGGGSVIDTSKAAAAALAAGRTVRELLDEGRDVLQAVPLVACSTLAGSGSECNAEAVLHDPATRSMQGLRGPGLFPRAAFVDPGLQAGLSWEITRRGAVDILSHVLERCVLAGGERTPFAMAEALLAGVLEQAEALRAAPEAPGPRAELCWSAIVAQNGSILACLGPGDWTLHVFAHCLAGRAPGLAHGDVVAALLPPWLRWLRGRSPQLHERLAQGVLRCTPDAACERLRSLLNDWGTPQGLADLGFQAAEAREAARAALEHAPRHRGTKRGVQVHEQVLQLCEEVCADFC